MADITKKIVFIISELLEANVDEGAQLGVTPNWDSLNHIRIIIEIEKKLGVHIGKNKAPYLTSVREIVSFLEKKVADVD